MLYICCLQNADVFLSSRCCEPEVIETEAPLVKGSTDGVVPRGPQNRKMTIKFRENKKRQLYFGKFVYLCRIENYIWSA